MPENAAASHAMQGVQMAQQAVDVAQLSYDASIAKQAKMAAAMAAVSQKLKGLEQAGELLVSHSSSMQLSRLMVQTCNDDLIGKR